MNKIYTGCIVALALVTTGCSGDIKETLGLNHHGPDEYQVLSRPALTVPPEFSLRPPAEGAEFTPAVSATDQAHATVIGTAPAVPPAPGAAPVTPTAATPATASASGFLTLAPTAVGAVTTGALPDPADSQFLNNAGADKADATVRSKILQDQQNGVTPKETGYLINTAPTNEPIVDATKEADRIKQDKQTNQPVTGADTPVVPQPDKGLLGDIF